VAATPVAEVVTTVAHAPDVIADVPRAEVPLAISTPKAPAVPVLTPKAVLTPVPVFTNAAVPKVPPDTVVRLESVVTVLITTFDVRSPESVNWQVVLVVEQERRWLLVGTALGPAMVLEALMPAAPAMVKAKAFEALSRVREPVVVLATPKVGVAVHEDAVVLEALGIVPAAALVAFNPPAEIGTEVIP